MVNEQASNARNAARERGPSIALSRRRALSLAIAGTGSMLLSACASAPSSPPVAPTATTGAALTEAAPPPAVSTPTALLPVAATLPPTAAPHSGGTLRYGMVGDLATLDGHVLVVPAYATLWQAYDRLTAYNLKLEPQPQLAESWDVSSDFKQVKFNLRKGVQFHSGRDFTSDDVKYNLLRVRDPKIGAGQLANESNWFSSIDTPDKYTVVLGSDESRPASFDFFENFNILDRDTMEGPNAKTSVVGTGPFRFVEWVQGDHLTLTKNPNYWLSGRPYLDGFQVSILRDQAALSAQFESGALDVIDSPSITDFIRLKDDPKYLTIVHPGNDRVYIVGANVQTPPMDNKLVRQAMFYAVDRQRFVDTILHGVGQAQSLFWNANSLAYEPSKGYTFDLDRAKSLLAQAGVSQLDVDIYTSTTGEITEFCQIYHADLAQIGVNLNIKPTDNAAFTSLVNTRKYTGLYTASATTPSEPSTTMIYSAGLNYTGNNNSGFTSDTYKQLVTAVSTEPDVDKRKFLYSQLNDLLVDEAFITALGTLTIRIATQAKVQDVAPLVHDTFSYTSAWLQP
jgi:peptide/nickel transport system substrate-binding protein